MFVEEKERGEGGVRLAAVTMATTSRCCRRRGSQRGEPSQSAA